MHQNLKEDEGEVGAEAGVGMREEHSRQRSGLCRGWEREEFGVVIQRKTLNRYFSQ